MSLGKQALAGMIWTYSQQFGTQALTFVVSVVLARILLPEEFGLIGMLAIFIGIGNTLFDGGMTSSLIRTAEVNQEDYSTVFYFNLVCSIIIYGILYLCAPLIADFYSQPSLASITRVYGLTFVISAFGAVQNTILTRELKFKKQALITFPAVFIGGVIGVLMAYKNWGVWSLVGLAITNSFFTSFFLWVSSKWHPILVFNKDKFRQHFHFGYKLTLSGILDIIFTNIYQIVIGKYYSAGQVGYYARANSLMMLPVSNVSGALSRVIFPIFSKVQDDIPRLKKAYKQVMQLVLFIITPIMIIMAVLAKPLIILLFTEKWLPMVPIFQIICASGILYPIHLYNLIVLQVKGRSDLFLKLEIIKKVVITIVLAITLYYGFYALLWGQLICSILALLINTHYAGKMLNYSGFYQIKDISPIFLFSTIMGFAMYTLNLILIKQTNILQILVCSAVGVIIYLSLALLFKFESLNDIKNLILKK
ncbi:lipopolysaccharide biosynthesis protein [Chryseobacterium wangxinyae]|uniref:lipopolysaccharide biosynthesis protein n=1 Tax=Chryseobacterium sp. CY350 TaxID=2997336 RepID=UPI00227092F2|nr:lipopolysaccharide biosynthesis protein [Chryseobacterium sp. CY350]MCY0979370.1 lipopolysaccharide biosynthesis protein [Chryseobacterium sp. CY350]WBZ97133.1 lipopolysaccharide biosynthesis protein [Chryseobacterium sp. CY350]